MRPHLIKCLQMVGWFTMFLVRKTCRNAAVKAMQCIPIRCVCCMPNMDGTPMIECCDCGEWFNIDCVSPSSAALNNTDEPWYCTDCNEETSSLCLYVLYIYLACEFHRISTWWRPLLALIFHCMALDCHEKVVLAKTNPPGPLLAK